MILACAAPPGDRKPVEAQRPGAKDSAPRVMAQGTRGDPRITVQVVEIAQTGPEAIAVKLVLSNPDPARPVVVGRAFADEATADGESLSGLYVVDEEGGKKVFVLRDAQGRPECSSGLASIPAGGRVEAWARYPMPRRDVKRLTLQVPGMAAFRDLAVAPAPGGTARPGPSY